jgi:hypothetical protein
VLLDRYPNVARIGDLAKRLAVVCVLLSSTACDQAQDLVGSACPAQTVTIADAACTSDMQCPAGTACTVNGDAGTASASCSGQDASDACSCVPAYFPDVPSDVLITGFGALEFELQVTTGTVTTFGWTAPENATSVICGLFVAAPEVSAVPTPRIDNAFKAIYGTHLFPVSNVSGGVPYTAEFTVADLTTPPDSDCVSGASSSTTPPLNDFRTPYPIVTMLQVACWAYGDVGVVAATRLQSLQVTELPETLPPVADCAGLPTGSDGRLCLLGPMVGGCIEGKCNLDAGLGSFNGDDDEGGIASVTPVLSCADASPLTLCELMTGDFVFGRCVGSVCADQDLAQVQLPLVTSDCAQAATTDKGTNWLNCFDEDVQGYGTCFDGSCHLRCVTSEDCRGVERFLAEVHTGSSLLCEKLDSNGTPTCNSSGSSFLGICVSSCP